LAVNRTTDLQSISSRFQPLGSDYDGRTYYALSHPPLPSKKPSLPDRARFANLAYCVFVWGRKPQDALLANGEDDDDVEGWWGFGEADDIRRLAKWRSYCIVRKAYDSTTVDSSLSSVLEPAVAPSDAQMKELVKGLEEFADFLDVRCGISEAK